MKLRNALAAIAAILAIPAYAASEPAPRPPRAPAPPAAPAPAPEPPEPAFGFNFNFDFGDVLADAEMARQQAEVAREHAETMRDWAENFATEMQGTFAMIFADRVGRGRVVKGAPYSAEVVTETNQPLNDGNVISHKRTSRVYRDSEGRTRQESVRGDVVRSVYIYDPVAGMSYTLLPGSKIAIGIPKHAPKVRIDKDKISIEQGENGERRVRTIIRKSDRDTGEPGYSREVDVQVIRVGEGDMKDIEILAPPAPPTPPVRGVAPVPPVPPVPPIPGVQTMRFDHFGMGKGTTAAVGTKTFDGVKAEGKQTTWTIPAGKIGNRAPIVVTSEAWYSPELQVTVYTRYNDPRSGESIYRLAGIKRSEPPADLFKVPDDYRVKGRRERDRERDHKEKNKEKDKDRG